MAVTERSKKDKIFHPDCEFYYKSTLESLVPELLAEECSDPRVSVVSMVCLNGGNHITVYFSKRVQHEARTRMTIHDIINRLKDVGREDLAKVLTPPQHSGRLRTDRDVAILLAMVHDRALGKDVDFHNIKGIREYGA